jgi:hypothetical protein
LVEFGQFGVDHSGLDVLAGNIYSSIDLIPGLDHGNAMATIVAVEFTKHDDLG